MIELLKKIIRCVFDRRYLYHYLTGSITEEKKRCFLTKIENFFFTGKFLSPNEKSALGMNGIIVFPGLVDTSDVNKILIYLNNLMIGSDEDQFSVRELITNTPKTDNVSHYSPKYLVRCDEIMKLATHPEILIALQKYFGEIPFQLDYVGAWKSYAKSEEAIEQQLFHRDIDTLQSIKVFCYLTDVDSSSGPHIFISKSLSDNSFRKKGKKYSDKEILKIYPKSEQTTIKGKKGTVFLTNSFALHKGMKPVTNDRVILQFIFSVVRTPFLRPKYLKSSYNFPDNYIYKNFL